MEEERPQSQFNMAVSYLGRMNNELCLAIEAAMRLDAFAWYHALLAFFRELSTETKNDKELQELEKISEEIHPHVCTWVNNSNRYGAPKMSYELYHKLHKFELRLRQVLKKSGLQNKMKEAAGAALR